MLALTSEHLFREKSEERIREKCLEWIETIFRSGLRNSTAPLHVSDKQAVRGRSDRSLFLYKQKA